MQSIQDGANSTYESVVTVASKNEYLMIFFAVNFLRLFYLDKDDIDTDEKLVSWLSNEEYHKFTSLTELTMGQVVSTSKF